MKKVLLVIWLSLASSCQLPAPQVSPTSSSSNPSNVSIAEQPELVWDFPVLATSESRHGKNQHQLQVYDFSTGNFAPRSLYMVPVRKGKTLVISGSYGISEFYAVSEDQNLKVQGPVKLPHETPHLMADANGNGQFLFWSTFVTGVGSYGIPKQEKETAKLVTLDIRGHKPQLPTRSIEFPDAGGFFNFSFTPRLDASGTGYLTGTVLPMYQSGRTQNYHAARIPVKAFHTGASIEVFEPSFVSYARPLAVLGPDKGLVLLSPSENHWVTKQFGFNGILGEEQDLGKLNSWPSLSLDMFGNGSILVQGADNKYKVFLLEDYKIKSESKIDFNFPVGFISEGHTSYTVKTDLIGDSGVILAYKVLGDPLSQKSDTYVDIQLSRIENGRQVRHESYHWPINNRLLYSGSINVDPHGNGFLAFGTTAHGGVDGRIHLIRMQNFLPQ